MFKTVVRAFAAALWCVALTGCLLGDVSLDGKACPCVEPYVCDQATNICVRALSDSGVIVAGDAEVAMDAAELDASGNGDASFADADEQLDAEVIDAAPLDAAPLDAESEDTGVPADAEVLPDTGVIADAGVLADSGVIDTGVAPDTGIRPDTGVLPDAGIVDTGLVDTGIPIDGGADAGSPDAGGFPLGTDCTQNTECASNFCLSVNTSSVTTDQFCSTPCSGTSDCPLNLSCINVNWMGFCLRESSFNPPLPFDVPSGGMCTQQVNMCQSSVCNTSANQCIERCSSEDDCTGFGNNCWTWAQGGNINICVPQAGGAVGTACTQNANCQSGICDRVAMRCSAHCCNDADCPANESCSIYDFQQFVLQKICRPRATNGTGVLGQTCTANGDCESEHCVAQNANGTGPRRCSTLCCENSDCAALLPNGGTCWPTSVPATGTWFGQCLPN